MNRIAVFTTIFLLLATSVFAADPPEPVLYFSFDEDDGDEVADMSGNENHGNIPINGKSVEGKFGNGLELGLPDTVDVKDSETLIFNDELTVGVWVNLVGVSNQKVIGKSPIGSGWVLGTNGGIYPEVWDKNGVNHTVTKGSVTAGEWTHLALTYSVATEAMNLYINGEEVGTLGNSGIPIGETGNVLILGASPWGKDWPSEGIYDEVKLYNIAFDADQVKTILMEEGVGSAAVEPDSKITTTWGKIKNLH